MGSTLIASPSCIFSILWLPCASAPLAENTIPIVKARAGVTRLLQLSMMEQPQMWADLLRGLSAGDGMGWDVSKRDCRVDRRKEIGKQKGESGVKEEHQSPQSWRCDTTGVTALCSNADAAPALSLGWSRDETSVSDECECGSYGNWPLNAAPRAPQARLIVASIWLISRDYIISHNHSHSHFSTTSLPCHDLQSLSSILHNSSPHLWRAGYLYFLVHFYSILYYVSFENKAQSSSSDGHLSLLFHLTQHRKRLSLGNLCSPKRGTSLFSNFRLSFS